jgi:hypothetical protein
MDQPGPFRKPVLVLRSCRVYRSNLLILTLTLETKNTIAGCKKGIISTLHDILTRMNPGSALTINDIAGLYELAVCSLGTKTLGLGITSVLGGTHSLLMSEKLKV